MKKNISNVIIVVLVAMLLVAIGILIGMKIQLKMDQEFIRGLDSMYMDGTSILNGDLGRYLAWIEL